MSDTPRLMFEVKNPPEVSYGVGVDASIQTLPPTPKLQPVITGLLPIFTSEGTENKCTLITSVAEAEYAFGKDVFNYYEHGIHAIYLNEILKAGGNVIACRLTNNTATKAQATLCVQITASNHTYNGFASRRVTHKVFWSSGSDAAAGVPYKSDANLSAVDTYPLLTLTAPFVGEGGNDYSFTIVRDPVLDPRSTDGRKYNLKMFKRLKDGTIAQVGQDVLFSFNPKAKFAPQSTTFMDIEKQYAEEFPNSGSARYSILPRLKTPYYDSYKALSKVINGEKNKSKI